MSASNSNNKLSTSAQLQTALKTDQVNFNNPAEVDKIKEIIQTEINYRFANPKNTAAFNLETKQMQNLPVLIDKMAVLEREIKKIEAESPVASSGNDNKKSNEDRIKDALATAKKLMKIYTTYYEPLNMAADALSQLSLNKNLKPIVLNIHKVLEKKYNEAVDQYNQARTLCFTLQLERKFKKMEDGLSEKNTPLEKFVRLEKFYEEDYNPEKKNGASTANVENQIERIFRSANDILNAKSKALLPKLESLCKTYNDRLLVGIKKKLSALDPSVVAPLHDTKATNSIVIESGASPSTVNLDAMYERRQAYMGDAKEGKKTNKTNPKIVELIIKQHAIMELIKILNNAELNGPKKLLAFSAALERNEGILQEARKSGHNARMSIFPDAISKRLTTTPKGQALVIDIKNAFKGTEFEGLVNKAADVKHTAAAASAPQNKG